MRKSASPAQAFAAVCVLLALVLTGCTTVSETSTTPQPASANQLAPTVSLEATQSNRTLPILFLVGDSTVHNAGPGLKGWGDVIARYFDPEKIRIENRARGGRSSRTFQTQGWWSNILTSAIPGDFVMIQLGHNDGGPLDDTNRARGTIPGLGGETKKIHNPVMNKPEVVHTYGWYMRKYIINARAKGMTPIICSPVPRLPKQTVRADTADTNSYVAWSREIARRENVFFIDLNHIVLSHYVGLTPAEIKAKYFTVQDNTHFNPAGAELNAASVVEGLRRLTNCPLRSFLLEEPMD